jgi:IS4 transposase
LLSIDGSVIDLCLSAFDWASYQREKGAAKLHLVLDHQGYLPRLAVITEGKASDLALARQMEFTPGTILVFDRGYQDYRWFERLTSSGVFFVTRLRCHAAYRVVKRLPVAAGAGVVWDRIVRLGAQRYRMGIDLRLIRVKDPHTGQAIVIVTNNFRLAASTISAVYRDRWQIEVFFRALKQNLRLKTFVGTSANAVRVQIWTALIAMLVLKYLQLRSQFHWSLSNLVALLRQQLFVYRDLWTWIDSPFQPPEVAIQAEQLALNLG